MRQTILAVCIAGVATVVIGPQAQAAPGRTAHQWLTVPNSPVEHTAELPIKQDTMPTGVAVHIEPNLRYQEVAGFGASITESSAHVLYGLSPEARDEVMTKLFSPRHGAGVSMLRQPIGASDFAVDRHYSYNENPGDYTMTRFSVAHDEEQILPLLRQAKRLNPDLRITASPWSPPGWMKTSGSVIDGKLIDKPEIYRAYALYLVKFLLAYRKAGVPVDYLTIQNEPHALRRNDYPGMDLPVRQAELMIDQLGPMIRAAGLGTKILGYDHNWAVHPFDVESKRLIGEDPELNYPELLLNTKAARWITGTAYHCYYGDPQVQTELRAAFGNKDIFQTECESLDIVRAIGVMRNWGRSVVAWNIALDENHGPHLGGCGVCTGIVTVDSVTKQVTYNDRYRLLKHFGGFVRPGATRVASTVTAPADLNTVAFADKDRSITLVANNTGATDLSFTVVIGNRSFDATLPPGATATYQLFDRA